MKRLKLHIQILTKNLLSEQWCVSTRKCILLLTLCLDCAVSSFYSELCVSSPCSSEVALDPLSTWSQDKSRVPKIVPKESMPDP